jgi:anti-sigma B factor antagonist
MMPAPGRRPRTGAPPVDPPSGTAAHVLTAEGRPPVTDAQPVTEPVIVRLPAEIDIANAEDVGEQLRCAFTPGITLVIADLTATVFCDSSGLRQLLLAHRRAQACHAQVRFAIPHREVLGVLQVTELDRLLSVYPSLNAAMSARPAPDGQDRQPPRIR